MHTNIFKLKQINFDSYIYFIRVFNKEYTYTHKLVSLKKSDEVVKLCGLSPWFGTSRTPLRNFRTLFF
jgi:hypothetical protein